MASETLPWLLFPPAVDLSNTVMVTPSGELDLLATEEQLDDWIDAERGRIPGVEAAAGRLDDVRELRGHVYALLHARARGQAAPEPARRRVNALSARVPVRAVLTRDGKAVEEPDAPDAYALFAAAVARSAIELAGRDGESVSVCGAPSCGMLFLREHPRQVWCSKPCGNRARVARHASRRRRGARAAGG